MKEQRPWGSYEILHEGQDCKIKRIVVNPGGILSLQRHKHRSETWQIMTGQGIVRKDENDIPVNPGDVVLIPVTTIHRISNPSTNVPLEFIEIQTGTYFGEDDIERLEDIYGREQFDVA